MGRYGLYQSFAGIGDVDELSDIISRMNDAEIMQINMLIYQLKCLLDDKNIPAI